MAGELLVSVCVCVRAGGFEPNCSHTHATRPERAHTHTLINTHTRTPKHTHSHAMVVGSGLEYYMSIAAGEYSSPMHADVDDIAKLAIRALESVRQKAGLRL